MDFKMFFTVFTTVFLAELGDKTQLATLVFSASGKNPWVVFAGSALGLVLAAGLGVLAGTFLARHVDFRYVHYFAGCIFIVLGIWTLIRA